MTLRRWSPAVAVAAVASMIAVGGVGASPSPQLARTSADARTQIEAFLVDLGNSVGAMSADPYLSALLDNAGVDPAHSVETAKQLVADLSAEDVAQLEEILASGPSIGALPEVIDQGVAAARGVYGPVDGGIPIGRTSDSGWASSSRSATFTDNCATAGDVRALAPSVIALNLAQNFAYALVVGSPGVFGVGPGLEVPNPIKIALGVVWGVLQAVYLALAQTFEVALDCAETKQADEQALALPVAGPPNAAGDPPEGTVVRGSSQITVDLALVAVGDIGDQLVAVVQNVGLVSDQVDDLRATTIDLNTTLSCTTGIPITNPAGSCGGAGQDVAEGDALARVTDTQGDLQVLQGDVEILRNTQHEILDKSNEEIEALETLAALQLRMEIEANLSLNGFHPVALFQLPPPWGHLDVVKEITTEVVAAYGRGGNFLNRANAAFTAGDYKLAYSLYQQAYQGATP